MTWPAAADPPPHSGDNAWDHAAVDLYARFQAGQVTPDQMIEELPPVWRSRSRADPLDSAAAWRAMVDHAGYFAWTSGQTTGRRARRPFRPRRLFRGATPDRRFGMSWTRNPDIAWDFAVNRQPDGVYDGQVWVGVFAPSQLLAYLGDEREYLVAAAGVAVVPWSSGDDGWLTRLRRRG